MLWYVSALHSFLWLNNFPLYGYTTFCLSAHQLVDIWVTSTFLDIINNADMNICARVFAMNTCFQLFGYIPNSRVAGSYGNSLFNFGEVAQLFPL